MLNPGEAGSQAGSGESQLLQLENLCWRHFPVSLLQTPSVPGSPDATFLPDAFVSGTVWSGIGDCGLGTSGQLILDRFRF